MVDIPVEFDIEHSRILEQFPMFALLGFFAVMALPLIPPEIKSPIMLFGLGSIFIFMLVVGPAAQFIASKYIPIKARIRPYNIEKTFFCRKPAGTIMSMYDEVRKIYTTPFELAIKTSLPVYGTIDGIILEHVRPFDERNVGSEIFVMFLGQEVTVARGILAELWISEENPVKVDHGNVIMRFELAVGGEDFAIVTKNRTDGRCGRYDIDLHDYSKGFRM